MVTARGYTGGPDHFRHRIAQLRPRRPREAYLRLRTLAGEQAQVDWAHFGKLTIGRAERPLMAFVLVLSYSRYPFVRFYLGASLANLIRGHVEAFSVLGGTARVLLYDNMKSVVLERRGDAIRFHPVVSLYVSWNPHGNSPVCFVDELLGMTKQSEKRSGPGPSPL